MSRVLVVDDHEALRSGVALRLERMGHEARTASSGAEALELLAEEAADLVITDYRMEPMDGLQLLQAVKERWTETDVIMVTAHGSIEVAVQAMQKGAADFVEKTDLNQVLPIKVSKVLENRSARHERDRLDAENEYLREEIGDRYGEIVGDSKTMRQVLAAVDRVSGTDSSVLIYGESGTGKELVARALHRNSQRRDGPFVRVNCGALPKELVESELFGHEKGAFTGAVRLKKGKFELAEAGTIFLDEVADLPADMQVNLLRVLQEKEFDRVGGERTLQADVRVVAATNRPLKEMVAEGTFREDLYYRLEVIPLYLPPLRERRDDIPLLVEHFLGRKSREINLPLRRLTEEALSILCEYAWPGNVRELENIIERTLVLSDGESIEPADLPLEAVATPADAESRATEADGAPLTERLEQLERELITSAIQQAHGVKTQAAQLLGIKTSALYYKLDKYGVEYAEET
jgi:two-component system response regulator HydG